MKKTSEMLNNLGLKLGNRSKHDIDTGNSNKNTPIGVKLIMGLISYYSSIANEDAVEQLELKLNAFVNSMPTEQIRGGIEINNMNDKYLSTESSSPLCTEGGAIILI